MRGEVANGSEPEEIDAEAAEWAAVYQAHAPKLQRLAVVLVGPADSHDLVSDAVMRAVHSPAWPGVANHGAYLVRAVVREAEQRHRSTTRRERRELRFTATTTDHATPDIERRMVVRQALDALSPLQRAVVFLHYWEDFTLDDSAAQLGIGVGTARTHLARAKRRLQTQLPNLRGDR